jgi:hypothetical protein
MLAPADGSPRLSVIEWFRRRQTPSAKAVKDFTRVAKDQGLPLDYDRDERLAKLLFDDDTGNLEEIAKLLGQSETDPKL